LGSFERHLLGLDAEALRLALDEADLPTVAIVHPGRLLSALR
jgi:hypothetical protein